MHMSRNPAMSLAWCTRGLECSHCFMFIQRGTPSLASISSELALVFSLKMLSSASYHGILNQTEQLYVERLHTHPNKPRSSEL